MAKISPFQGVVYNQALAGVMTDLVCPPYDIISPEEREKLYQKSPYNVIRLEYGAETAADTEQSNRYTRAAAFLNEWLENGVLQQDDKKALYVYELEYQDSLTNASQKATKKFRGFVCLVKIEEYESGIINPHENTLSGPKTDRLNLLRACKTAFSQIYSLYSDPDGSIGRVLAGVTRKPDREVRSDDGVAHRMWALTEEHDVDSIVRAMESKPLFIADGHHRYDTALNYRNERRQAAGTFTGEEPYNYTAMFLSAIEDPGITILPAHRTLMNMDDFNAARLEKELHRYFAIEKVDFHDKNENKNLTSLLDTMAHRGKRGHIFGMRLKGKKSYYLLTLRNEADMDSLIPDRAPEYRKLDVSILHHLIFDSLLGLKIETHKLGRNIDYIKDPAEAEARLRNGGAEAVFFMNPTKVEEVKKIAAVGERMPQKATYFYPKIITGLVMNKLE